MGSKREVLIVKEKKMIFQPNKLKNQLILLKTKINNVNHIVKVYIIINLKHVKPNSRKKLLNSQKTNKSSQNKTKIIE